MAQLIAAIDFEANALSAEADVIEVGVAIYDRHETIKTWSSLVRPRPAYCGAKMPVRFVASLKSFLALNH